MKKKLIEVALPLEAINKESAREKSLRHGHPSTLHLWWARRPLAACRAVLFASLVDDPSSLPDQFPTENDQDKERQRLFRLIEQLVLWENSNNRVVLDAARQEILKSTDGKPPIVYDPFCGGGSIPLEAHRLGLRAKGTDLNPIAVLITKSLIEIPPKFRQRPPVNPGGKKQGLPAGAWIGVHGLAEDVRYYGKWMRDRAFAAIGSHYPEVQLQGGGRATVIAWVWARTAQCPNPACDATIPLVTSYALSSKPHRRVWLQPVPDRKAKKVTFEIVVGGEGPPPEPTKVGRGAHFRCPLCGSTASEALIREQFKNKDNSKQLLAIVAEGDRSRIYLPPDEEHLRAAMTAKASWLPEEEMDQKSPNLVSGRGYGITHWRELFTDRQLLALSTFSDLIAKVRKEVVKDGGDESYADAVATYLAFAVDRSADFWSSLATWSSQPKNELVVSTFRRQALPMTWDFAEVNPFSNSGGSFENNFSSVAKVLDNLCVQESSGEVCQLDAAAEVQSEERYMICTDPPYYDNIGYAELSDFFYIWLRRSAGAIYPQLFSTLLTPKSQELVATPHRFDGDRSTAQRFFESGLGAAFQKMRQHQDRRIPLTVFYAFKQAENDADDESRSRSSSVASTGWETMLEGLLSADLQITGTWPMRSERANRSIAIGTNALASSIVLVCRVRSDNAPITTRKDFLFSLKQELPRALRDLQKGNIAPVDLAQAAIGPGMAVFSRYKKVLETDGSPMRVRTALALINQGLDEVLSELESEFDPDTRWALAWFEQHQFEDGLYGEAEVLGTAKALSISHLAETGILHSRAGKVRLLRREELPEDWDPSAVARLTVWEVTQHLIRSLDQKGEKETANLKARIGGMAEIARDLAYRLYTLCERKGWADEAGYYNSLVVAWPSMASEAFELK